MLSVEVKNDKSNHKSLIVVLILLCVVAIVLAVIIVVMNSMNNSVVDKLDDGNLAKECLLKEDDASREYCLSDKSFELYEAGDCEKALKVYDDIPAEMYDDRHLAYLYDQAYGLSLTCEDEALETYWEDKLNALTEHLEAVD